MFLSLNSCSPFDVFNALHLARKFIIYFMRSSKSLLHFVSLYWTQSLFFQENYVAKNMITKCCSTIYTTLEHFRRPKEFLLILSQQILHLWHITCRKLKLQLQACHSWKSGFTSAICLKILFIKLSIISIVLLVLYWSTFQLLEHNRCQSSK